MFHNNEQMEKTVVSFCRLALGSVPPVTQFIV